MKNIRREIALWVQAIIFIGLWMLLVYLSQATAAISVAALTRIPDVVFIYGILYLLFTKWLWRLRILRGWLIPFPDLQGTWNGTITSTLGRPKYRPIARPDSDHVSHQADLRHVKLHAAYKGIKQL